MFAGLKPINEMVKNLRERCEQEINAVRARYEKYISEAEEYRRIIPMLDAEGVPMFIPQWDDVGAPQINLGYPKLKREKKKFVAALRAIRRVLECPLKKRGTYIENSRRKTVKVTLEPEKYPGIQITYIQKLPKDAKCKIVRKRQRYTSTALVCER